MKLDGRHTFAAGREVVWGVLYDPVVLGSILPGGVSFEAVAPDEYRVTLQLRVGQTVELFSGTLWLERVAPFTGFDFHADGESPDGLVNARGRVYLEDAAEGGTSLCYEAQIEVGGRLSNVTGRLLETTARAFTRRCLEGLERQVDMRTRIYTSLAAPVAPPTPTGTTVRRLAGLRRAATLLGVLVAVLVLLRGLDRRRTRGIARQVAELLAPAQPAIQAGAGNPDLP